MDYTSYDAVYNLTFLLYQLNIISWNTHEPFIDLPAPTMVEQYAARLAAIRQTTVPVPLFV